MFCNFRAGFRLFVVFAACVLAGSFTVKADQIVVGVLSFDNLIPSSATAAGVNTFTIDNFTGTNSQQGTPDSAISFLNTTLLLNGSQNVNVSRVDPGSVQPSDLQFSTTATFTDAELDATLSTTDFTIAGENYVATSDTITADLSPSSPPDLEAGTDFVVLYVTATDTGAVSPEPGAFGLVLAPLAALLWQRSRRRRA